MSDDGGSGFASQSPGPDFLMRLLLTGAHGFTGQHLSLAASVAGYEVFSLEGNLQEIESLREQVHKIHPTHVVHLAGISHVTGDHELAYYEVNLLGSLNLLKALKDLVTLPQKVILASTAHVYGNYESSSIKESERLAPISHYAMSKLAMEYMSQPFLKRFPLVLTRPFNYTGVGHDSRFVIPKIIEHFRCKAPVIELGDIDVLREYNDVRDVCDVYLKLLLLGKSGQTYNIASGRSHSLRQVIASLEKLSGHVIRVEQNPQFLRVHEMFNLAGDSRRLEECIGELPWRSLEATLQWMLNDQIASTQVI